MPVAVAAGNSGQVDWRLSLAPRAHRLFVPARFAGLERTERGAGDGIDKFVHPSVLGCRVQSLRRSIPQALPQTLPQASPPAELDLAYARAAAAEALSRGSRDASLPWQNPHSGARGNITPLATSYSEAGMACRDFLASYMHGGSQDWLEGAACQTGSGSWEIRRLKPLTSS